MKLFQLTETINNEKYYVEVFESEHYIVDVINSKEFNYKNFEVKVKNYSTSKFPKIYISLQEDETYNIEIQTTSYGAISEEQFIEFVSIQKKAIKQLEEIKLIVNKK